ncbi:uncharacterized protein LOC117648622 [Thrips palmi]|uniref:Uncharacterized protein LOC117648622 n=1 Tax=Thrips palmi TaxID=161013 RepID=A0A6P8ZR78_THRPL|nr:uncharacterized protein LOC117648622 [Thrips palmi]
MEVPPATPEAYYVPTGREVQPQPVGEEVGQVVFQYYPVSAVNYFSRSSVGGSRILTPAWPPDLRPDDLRFESRFESGNLAKVVRITETYYELYLRTDLYTNRHMQWFYFRVENMRRRAVYRFSIVNLSKAESLYSCGMRPLLYSERDAQLNQAGWRRCGDNIAYFRNEEASPSEEQAPSYTLSFNVDFPHDNDTCYLAHCYPYTYSDLQDYLLKLQNHPVKSTFSKLRLLCRSLAGNNVYYLTITTPPPPPPAAAVNNNNVNNNCNGATCANNNNNNNPQGSPTRCAACAAATPAPPPPEEPKKKKAVVLTARVHPGETPSSWMMKGFMDFLTGNSNQAKELRDKFIFKLVPMLNPDGVIVGNNRCSLTGRDLNRQYRTVIRETYPPVWHTKLMIRRLMEECGVVMYCDLHAHSRKHNIFIYGCENKRGPDKQLQEQVFPLMLHKNAADKFSFENCKFRIQRSKEGTGRVVVWMMGVANSYTMEASFGGSTLGSRAATHFSAQDFENMGRAFCETLLDFCDQDPSKERLRNKIISRLVKEGSSADEPTNIILSDYSSDEGDTSSSSEDEANMTEGATEAPNARPMRGLGLPAACSGLCHGLCHGLGEPCPVPPPSPSLPRRKPAAEGGTGSPKRGERADRTPPMPRKTLHVHTTLLDLPGCDAAEANTATTTPELQSSAETSPSRQQATARQRASTSPDDGAQRASERVDMPPELIVTPAHRRRGRGRHGSTRDLRDGDTSLAASTALTAQDGGRDATSTDTSTSPSVVHRRRSLSVLADVSSALRGGPSGAARPASQHGRSLPNARRRHGSARRPGTKRASTPTPTPVPQDGGPSDGQGATSPTSPLPARGALESLSLGRVWLGTPCQQCQQCDVECREACNNYTANVPLAWGPPPGPPALQHDQQEVLRSCSQKLSALSALQRPRDADRDAEGRSSRRRRSKASLATPATAATTPSRKSSGAWLQRPSGPNARAVAGAAQGSTVAAAAARGSLSGLRGQPGQHGGAGTSMEDEPEAEASDAGRTHWRRGQLRLRRQKRQDAAGAVQVQGGQGAARVVEEAVGVLGAQQGRRAKAKQAGTLPAPSSALGPAGLGPADIEALSLSRRARFRRGAALANPGPLGSAAPLAADGGLQEPGPASDDPAIDAELAKVKKKKKRKLGLPKRVKRVLSATAAITNKTSEKPR